MHPWPSLTSWQNRIYSYKRNLPDRWLIPDYYNGQTATYILWLFLFATKGVNWLRSYYWAAQVALQPFRELNHSFVSFLIKIRCPRFLVPWLIIDLVNESSLFKTGKRIQRALRVLANHDVNGGAPVFSNPFTRAKEFWSNEVWLRASLPSFLKIGKLWQHNSGDYCGAPFL